MNHQDIIKKQNENMPPAIRAMLDPTFAAEYELALRIGNKRFGSECKHERVYAGRCCDCLRRVVTK